ncbi:hypothetical protein NQD34_012726 [Periophthalmus magnuspinnatus]|nr:hypothetical protein NQD34_012726 [Periophthalmus magnuspinnatus]
MNKKTSHQNCWLSIKVFGNEVFSYEDIYNEINQLCLSVTELAIKPLKGQDSAADRGAGSGLSVQAAAQTVNHMTSLLSLRLPQGHLSLLPQWIRQTQVLSDKQINYHIEAKISATGSRDPLR